MSYNFNHQWQNVSFDRRMLLLLLFLMRVGQFSLLPFLAIYMVKHFSVSAAKIGLVVGAGPFAYGICAILAGIVVDRVGVKPAAVIAALLAAVNVYFFFYQDAVYWLFLMNAVTGATRSLFDVATKSYGGEMTLAERKFNFSLRYIVINSAAAIGPVLGAYFAEHDTLIAFKIIGVMYLMLAVIGGAVLQNTNKLDAAHSRPTVLETFAIIGRDHALQVLLLLTFLTWCFFSQIDSTIPQYLYKQLPHGVALYSVLLIINALGCVFLQMLVARIIRNYNDSSMSALAMVMFAVTYVIMAWFLSNTAWIIAIILFTLAEIILMPLNDVLLAKMAPPKLIGTYYGAVSTGIIGLGIGPIIGGVVYEYYGAKVLFVLCALLALLCISLYKLLLNLMAKRTPHQ